MQQETASKRPCNCNKGPSVADIAAKYPRTDDAIGDRLADAWFAAVVLALSSAAALTAVAIAVRAW